MPDPQEPGWLTYDRDKYIDTLLVQDESLGLIHV